MVSSSLGMTLDELVEALDRMRTQYAGDADYQSMRKHLPADWPM